MRITIIGNSGSGKSTLAGRLAADSGTSVLDLDTIAWEPGKIAVPRDAEDAWNDVREFCASNERWIVEGCYASLAKASLPFQPNLLVLDPGLDQCTANCRARPWEPHKYSSKAEQDKHLSFLLEWAEAYYSRDDDMSLAAHRAVYDRYDGPKQWLSAMTDPLRHVDETK